MKQFFKFIIEMFLAAPLYVAGYFVYSLLEILPTYVCNVYFLKTVIEKITRGQGLAEIIPMCIGIFLFLVLSDIYIAWFTHFLKPVSVDKVTLHFQKQINKAIGIKEISLYDNAEYRNDLEYILNDIEENHLSALTSCIDFITKIINVVLIMNLLKDIGLMLSILTVFSVTAAFVLDKPASILDAKRKEMRSHAERKKKYFLECFFSQPFWKERKMLDADGFLFEKYENAYKSISNIINKYGKKLAAFSFFKNFISSVFIMNFVTIAYLVYEIKIAGRMTYGDFAAGYNGVNIIISNVLSLIAVITDIRKSNYFILKYYNFIGNETQVHKTEKKEIEIEEIELKEISFTYPHTNREVLHNISFCIKRGDKIAIVGRNGSGKSTLVHLLMGLYQPDRGKIFVNGKQLSWEARQDYCCSFSAFFQDEKTFSASVAENVALDVKYDEERVKHALKLLDCRLFEDMAVSTTMIGRDLNEDGVILSGGETQKLMLAYCSYAGHSAVVLDEPSSSLDPVGEMEIHRIIYEMAKEKTVIFVSHRLSTVTMADKIYVIDDGRVVESGTHEELLKQGTLYKKMWEIQAQKYI